MFLGFHCIFLTCYMPPSMFTACPPCCTVFYIVSASCYKHFLACTHRFPNIVTTFLPVSTAFSTVSCGYFLLFVDFHCVLSSFFYYMLPTIFHRFPLWFFVPFPLVSCISCIFNIFFQEFYPSPSVSDRFCTIFLWLLSHFPALSLYFSSMFTASSFVPSSRSGFLHVPTDFAPFILVVITFSCRLLAHFPSLYLSSIFQWILHDFL